MKLDIFTFCDNAQDYNGKLVIVGTFNRISLPNIPGPAAPFSVAARILIEPSDDPASLSLHFTIKDVKSGNDIITPIESPIPSRKDGEKFGTLNLALNLGGVVFPNRGEYNAILAIGQNEWTSPLSVSASEKK